MCRKNIFVVFPLILIFSFSFLPGCKQHRELSADEKEAIEKKIAADELHEELRKPQPPIDPAICKNHPEGYLYFKVGDELFRVNKDSPLVIAGVFPELDKHNHPIINTSGIAKGCEGNPFKAGNNGDFYFGKNYKVGRDDLIIQAELDDLSYSISAGSSPGLIYELYSMEEFKWQDRNKGYREKKYGDKGEFICQDVAENLTHCEKKSLGDTGLRSKFGLYISNSSVYDNIQKLPFVLMCDPAIPEVKCITRYRLYPTVHLEYSIRYKNPNRFNPANFLLFDQYMRQMYESMRVKN